MSIPPNIENQLIPIEQFIQQISPILFSFGADSFLVNKWANDFGIIKESIESFWEAKNKDKVVDIKNYLEHPPTWKEEIEGLEINERPT